jgi:hypothetical protein
MVIGDRSDSEASGLRGTDRALLIKSRPRASPVLLAHVTVTPDNGLGR